MAKEPKAKKVNNKLDQAGQPVKPSIFAFPHSGDITHSKKKKTLLLFLVIVVFLLAVALIVFINNRSNKDTSRQANSSQETFENEQRIESREPVVYETSLPAPETEAGQALIAVAENLNNIDSLPEEEQPFVYYDAAILYAAFEQDIAKDYAQKFLEYGIEDPEQKFLARIQLIADGKFAEANAFSSNQE